MADAIQIHELRRSFGGITAVDGVTLAVRDGEMFGIVGPDGAGKTTLIRMLCGLLVPDSGEGMVAGHNVVRDPDSVKRRIGYLSQRFTLYGDLSIDENIEFFAEIHGVYNFRDRREELLAFTRLTPFRERLAERLSGGMKQKLALACTLVHRPSLLFLDEPTTGVDPVSRRDFWRILQTLTGEGITVVMSTPYLDEAERCNRVGLMNNGSLLAVAEPETLKQTMRGKVIEIVCDRVRDAFSLLQSLPAAREVQAFGDRLNAIVDSPDRDIPSLLDALAGAGISVRRKRIVVPSLENVFISLLTQQST